MNVFKKMLTTTILILTVTSAYSGEYLTSRLELMIQNKSEAVVKEIINEQYPKLNSESVTNAKIYRSKMGSIFEQSIAANFNELTRTHFFEGARTDVFYMSFQIETKDGQMIDKNIYMRYSTDKRELKLINRNKKYRDGVNPDSKKKFILKYDSHLVD